jgi:predicted CXXCH cytochrome family protein
MRRRAFVGIRKQAWVMVAMVVAGVLSAATIRGTKHDLSTAGSPGSDQVCMFCHSPHNANNTLGTAHVPLWNRYVDTSIVFTPYTSSTMINQGDNPSTTPSAVCLGCHDGTLGYSVVFGTNGDDKHYLISGVGGEGDGSYNENCIKCHVVHAFGLPNDLKFGKDLRNMHPVAITYPSAPQSPQFRTPTDVKTGWSDVKLYNGRVECATCHAVHDPTLVPFLRKSNSGSALCLTCHLK